MIKILIYKSFVNIRYFGKLFLINMRGWGEFKFDNIWVNVLFSGKVFCCVVYFYWFKGIKFV